VGTLGSGDEDLNHRIRYAPRSPPRQARAIPAAQSGCASSTSARRWRVPAPWTDWSPRPGTRTGPRPAEMFIPNLADMDRLRLSFSRCTREAARADRARFRRQRSSRVRRRRGALLPRRPPPLLLSAAWTASAQRAWAFLPRVVAAEVGTLVEAFHQVRRLSGLRVVAHNGPLRPGWPFPGSDR
jgi:hypothetical protein